jgi:predicted Zn-dependent protease
LVRFFALSCLAAALVLSSCTSSERTDKEKLEAQLSPAEKQKLADYKAEVEIGRNMAGRLLQYYGTFGDENLIGYVNQVVNYVASYGDYPDRKYMVAIIDSDMVNAFACPGGYILISLGALRAARDEAELAAILGHESAHVGKQHMFNTLKAMKERELEKNASNADKKKSVSVFFESKVRERPKPKSKSELASLLTRYAGSAAGAGFSILKAAKAGMSVMLEKGLDKKLEFEADHEGVKYAIRAGYEPKAMLHFLRRLQKKKKKLNMKVLSKTHPKISARKSRIKKLLKEMKASEIIGARGKARFVKYTKVIPAPKKKSKA